MNIYPKSLEELISFYSKLPGVGSKSAERFALATLNFSEDEINDASKILLNAKMKLKKCPICGILTDQDICNICSNENRKKNIICVVEDYKSALAMEKIGTFKGVYHVLDGLISPIEGVGAEDINLAPLVSRINNLSNVELILALKGTIEGETTTLYIKKIFSDKNVLISRLSYGLPIGADLEYLDMLTLDKAFNDRKKISD